MLGYKTLYKVFETPEFQLELTLPKSPIPACLTPVPEAPLDLNTLGEFTGHNPAQTLRLARHFAETARKTLVEIKTARDSSDLGTLNRLGHKLKSSAAMAGARECASLCIQLEKAPDLTAAFDLVARLEPVVGGISTYVQSLGEQPAGG